MDGVAFTFKVFTDTVEEHNFFSCVYRLVIVKRLITGIFCASHLNVPCFESHRGEAINVFKNEPSGLNFSDNSQHFGEQMAFVVNSETLSCLGKGLTGESACKNIDPSSKRFAWEDVNIIIDRNPWKILCQDLLTKLITFAKGHCLPAKFVGSVAESANAAE